MPLEIDELGDYYYMDVCNSSMSDIVPLEFILKAVENCDDKEYCKLVVELGETTTKGGRSSYYNSRGQLILQDDNKMSVYVLCKTCSKVVKVSGNIEKTEI